MRSCLATVFVGLALAVCVFGESGEEWELAFGNDDIFSPHSGNDPTETTLSPQLLARGTSTLRTKSFVRFLEQCSVAQSLAVVVFYMAPLEPVAAALAAPCCGSLWDLFGHDWSAAGVQVGTVNLANEKALLLQYGHDLIGLNDNTYPHTANHAVELHVFVDGRSIVNFTGASTSIFSQVEDFIRTASAQHIFDLATRPDMASQLELQPSIHRVCVIGYLADSTSALAVEFDRAFHHYHLWARFLRVPTTTAKTRVQITYKGHVFRPEFSGTASEFAEWLDSHMEPPLETVTKIWLSNVQRGTKPWPLNANRGLLVFPQSSDSCLVSSEMTMLLLKNRELVKSVRVDVDTFRRLWAQLPDSTAIYEEPVGLPDAYLIRPGSSPLIVKNSTLLPYHVDENAQRQSCFEQHSKYADSLNTFLQQNHDPVSVETRAHRYLVGMASYTGNLEQLRDLFVKNEATFDERLIAALRQLGATEYLISQLRRIVESRPVDPESRAHQNGNPLFNMQLPALRAYLRNITYISDRACVQVNRWLVTLENFQTHRSVARLIDSAPDCKCSLGFETVSQLIDGLAVRGVHFAADLTRKLTHVGELMRQTYGVSQRKRLRRTIIDIEKNVVVLQHWLHQAQAALSKYALTERQESFQSHPDNCAILPYLDLDVHAFDNLFAVVLEPLLLTNANLTWLNNWKDSTVALHCGPITNREMSIPKQCPDLLGPPPFLNFTIPKFFVIDYLQLSNSETTLTNLYPIVFAREPVLEAMSLAHHLQTSGGHIWTALVRGKRRWYLFADDQREFLYENENYTGFQVNPANPDLQKHPLYALSKMKQVVQNAGDILYIPASMIAFYTDLESVLGLTFQFFTNHATMYQIHHLLTEESQELVEALLVNRNLHGTLIEAFLRGYEEHRRMKFSSAVNDLTYGDYKSRYVQTLVNSPV